MELLLIFLVLLCSILFICIALIYKFSYKFETQKATQVNGKNLHLPPGSKGWPFIGEMLDYIYHIYNNGVPEKFVDERKKKYSTKVFKTSLLGESVAILCGAEGNKFLFSNENKLVRVWFPSYVDHLFPYSGNISVTNQSTRLRRLVISIFKVDALRKSVSIMDSVMKQHMISEWNSEKVVVSSMARKYTSRLSCKLFMSINEVNTTDEFLKLTEIIYIGLHSMPINLPGTAFNRGIKASKAIRKEIEKMIKQRRTEIGEKCSSTVPQDIITHMLLNTDDNGQFLSEFDIAVLLIGLLEAAYANQHNTITLVMMHLSELPDVYDSVLREQLEIAQSKEPDELLTWKDLSCMKYTWNVVCEVLRLFPPVGQFREAITDFEYSGYHIPKGWKIHWIARDVHRNSEYFQDSDKFDPTRFEGNGPSPYTYVPFGGGPRMCPGMEYARLSILVFIHNAVTKFRWEKVIPNEKLIHGAFSTPADGLPIHLHPLKS